jgi:hypothetical protein
LHIVSVLTGLHVVPRSFEFWIAGRYK